MIAGAARRECRMRGSLFLERPRSGLGGRSKTAILTWHGGGNLNYNNPAARRNIWGVGTQRLSVAARSHAAGS
jgi:hypothetical protein